MRLEFLWRLVGALNLDEFHEKRQNVQSSWIYFSDNGIDSFLPSCQTSKLSVGIPKEVLLSFKMMLIKMSCFIKE